MNVGEGLIVGLAIFAAFGLGAIIVSWKWMRLYVAEILPVLKVVQSIAGRLGGGGGGGGKFDLGSVIGAVLQRVVGQK